MEFSLEDGGKCVSGDTYLFTNRGTIQIKDLFDCKENGIEDYTPKIDLSIVNKNNEHEKIDRGVYNGYKGTKKIKTNYGFELECSNNHPIMIEKQNGEVDYVLAKDLKINDKVLISTNNDIWGNETYFNKEDINNKLLPKYIMCGKKDIAKKALQEVFSKYSYMENNTMFIYGCSKDFIKQIQLLLLNFGVISKSIYDDKYRLKIETKDINKTERNYFLDEIVEIQDSKSHVYDISIPDTHSFVSNGFISHNTWGEVISMFILAVLYPGITMSLTAQTKANAAELLKDKYDEITRQYPLLKNEMLKPRIAKDDFELTFTNGSRIDVLANAQSSKGQRRNRIQIEESALIDNYTFEDALKPIVEIGRTTQGKIGIPDPQELNQQINFFTTSG